MCCELKAVVNNVRNEPMIILKNNRSPKEHAADLGYDEEKKAEKK